MYSEDLLTRRGGRGVDYSSGLRIGGDSVWAERLICCCMIKMMCQCFCCCCCFIIIIIIVVSIIYILLLCGNGMGGESVGGPVFGVVVIGLVWFDVVRDEKQWSLCSVLMLICTLCCCCFSVFLYGEPICCVQSLFWTFYFSECSCLNLFIQKISFDFLF